MGWHALTRIRPRRPVSLDEAAHYALFRRDGFLASVSAAHGFPVRDSMYVRIRRLTTCEGVESSSAQRRSKTAFLRGSIRIVKRAVRSSTVKMFSFWGYV
jgi:hypothetical protein